MKSTLKIGVLWEDKTWTEEVIDSDFTNDTSADVVNKFVGEWGREHFTGSRIVYPLFFVPLEIVEYP